MRTTQSVTRAAVLTSPPAFKTGPPVRFPERDSLPFPHFVVFALVREARSPYPRSYFSFMAQGAEFKTGQDEYPIILTTPRQFSSDFETDDGFWSDALRMVD
ncbi:hypothetical protein AVEN_181654-1 [Araneus ventricosus]|uniref:Uncharacterized protein n=1 Tax=Araneus ventricosus TaxID=182803 RepID=A0A4Y2UWJ1_ARAVE|nr:hypothetical protein AVEN_181654-1 [Araneus ventricosus]